MENSGGLASAHAERYPSLTARILQREGPLAPFAAGCYWRSGWTQMQGSICDSHGKSSWWDNTPN